MKKVTKEQLPDVLKEKRGTASQAEFANRFTGVHRQTVAAWEAGDYLPKPEILAQLNIRVVYEVGK